MKITRHSYRGAAYVFLVKRGQVLLFKRFQTGYKDGEYSTIAGHIEPAESAVACAIREATEEAMVKLLPLDLKLFHVMNRHSDYDYLDFFFVCRKWAGSPKIGEPRRCDGLDWFALEHLPDNTIDYVREVLQFYKNKIQFSAYGW